MKPTVYRSFPVILVLLTGLFLYSPLDRQITIWKNDRQREQLKSFYANYEQDHSWTLEEVENTPKEDRPDLAMAQNFLMTMDPSVGRPTPERLPPIMRRARKMNNYYKGIPGGVSTPWEERGPNNVGGRTRALIFDPNDVNGKRVFAGGVAGGLWVNQDITDANNSWQAIDDFWANLAISTMAVDPTNTQIFYVGTGEGWSNADAVRGLGIWKSTDGGTTWSQLSSTAGFWYVNKIMVHPVNGDVYAGTRFNGLQRSTDGGSSWTKVLGTGAGAFSNRISDVEFGADNTLWVAVQDDDVFSSSTGNSGSFTRHSSGFYSSPERIELATAPSDANYVYAVVEDNSVVAGIYRTTNKGSSWTSVSEPADADNGIPNDDFSRRQAWYDLTAAVDPNDRQTVIVGAIDLFKTTNGGSSWTQISKWSNNANLNTLSVPFVHADQHAIVYKPGSSSEVIFGNDGGVFYASNIQTINSGSIIARNKDYNVTQFYAGAIHPTAGTDFYLAGAQDNGSHRFDQSGVNSTTRVTGGDGAFCFIDQTDPTYQVTSYVYNYWFRSTNGGASFGLMQSDQSTGRFINPADYDDNTNLLFSARTSSTLNRIEVTSGSVDNISVSIGGTASHVRASPYAPAGKSTLFVGNGSGELYKITEAQSNFPVTTEITGTLPAGYISCVDVGASEDELLVTYSNYGVNSVWYTANGGATWQNKEGDLPDMPVRWGLFNPNNRSEVILATEVGIWATSDISAGSPSWTASNNGIANCRVDMLQYRASDSQVIAVTHGRGLFSSDAFAVTVTPVADFTVDPTVACVNQTVTCTDASINNPTSWNWSITPGTYTFTGGTNASSQDIQVQFTQAGTYTIALTATNSAGSDTETKTNVVQIGGNALPFTEDWETPGALSLWEIDNPDGEITWADAAVSGNSPGSNAVYIDNFNYTDANSSQPRDGLISPPLNFSGYTEITMTFDQAYARFNSSFIDSMSVFVSLDCGNTWTRVVAYDDTDLATRSDLNSQFTPSVASDWCGNGGFADCKTVNLTAFAGNASVRIKFENISGWGNQLYLDNINIVGTNTAPTADFTADNNTICAGDKVQFTDASTGTVSSWNWSITPGTGVSFTGSNTDQNPEVTFNNDGDYSITLDVTGPGGSDTKTVSNMIHVDPVVAPTINIQADVTEICDGENVTFTANISNGGSAPTIAWYLNGSNTGATGTSYSNSTLNDQDDVFAILTSNAPCATPNPVTSNTETITVNPVVTPEINIAADDNSICEGETVTFTATIQNGGSNPTIEWFLNGSTTGQFGNTYSGNTFNDGDNIGTRLSSNAVCANPQQVPSNVVTMDVTAQVTPTIFITASSTSICEGDNVDFQAFINNGGSAPQIEWFINGANTGSTGSTYSSTSLSDQDVVTARLTSNAACADPQVVISNQRTISVAPQVVPDIQISADKTETCAGGTVQFTATIDNGGSAPQIEWFINGANTGSTGSTYSSSTLADQDAVTAHLTSNANCASPTTDLSDEIVITVTNTIVPEIEIDPASPSVCDGENITFTATTTGGGSSSVVEWYLNGANTGITGTSYTSGTLSDNDNIYAVLTSSESCASPTSDQSNTVQVDVIDQVTPAINITAGPTEVCAGESIDFNASISNGGNNPVIEWFVNGGSTGVTGSNYSSTSFGDQDVITAVLTSDHPCPDAASVTSNGITVTVHPITTTQIDIAADQTSICEGETIQFSATIQGGGSSPMINWFTNGVSNGATGPNFTGSSLSDGDEISASLQSSATCPSPAIAQSNNIAVEVSAIVTPEITISANRSTICDGENVIFSANTTGGGSSPAISWNLNGASTGVTGPTYSNNTLANGDQVSAILTSSLNCANPSQVSSNVLSTEVLDKVVPEITISADETSVCQDTEVHFTSTVTNGGSNPQIAWRVNGSLEGMGSTFNYTGFGDGDVVTADLTSNANCADPATIGSNTIQMQVEGGNVPTISISADTLRTCESGEVVFTATYTDGGNNPTFNWYVNGQLYASSLTPVFSVDGFGNDYDIQAEIISSNLCDGSTPPKSNILQVDVIPDLAPLIDVLPDDLWLCSGEALLAMATIADAGTSPVIEWLINGTVVASGASASLTYPVPADGDVLGARIISDYICPINNPGIAAPHTVKVTDEIVLDATIALVNGPLCGNSIAQFEANHIPYNEAIVYEWFQNGVSEGTSDNNNYTLIVQDGHVVSASLAYDNCMGPQTAITNDTIITIFPEHEATLDLVVDSACGNDDPFSLEGGTPTGGQYIGSPVVNNDFHPDPESTGWHKVVYRHINANGCRAEDEDSVFVKPVPVSPDILQSDDSLYLASDYTLVEWYKDGELISSGPEDYLIIEESGLYQVVVRNEFSCLASSDEAFYTVGITKRSLLEAKVYPIPARDYLILEMDGPIDGVVVRNVVGQTLQVKWNLVETGRYEIRVKDWSKGWYYLTLHADSKVRVLPFLIE